MKRCIIMLAALLCLTVGVISVSGKTAEAAKKVKIKILEGGDGFGGIQLGIGVKKSKQTATIKIISPKNVKVKTSNPEAISVKKSGNKVKVKLLAPCQDQDLIFYGKGIKKETRTISTNIKVNMNDYQKLMSKLVDCHDDIRKFKGLKGFGNIITDENEKYYNELWRNIPKWMIGTLIACNIDIEYSKNNKDYEGSKSAKAMYNSYDKIFVRGDVGDFIRELPDILSHVVLYNVPFTCRYGEEMMLDSIKKEFKKNRNIYGDVENPYEIYRDNDRDFQKYPLEMDDFFMKSLKYKMLKNAVFFKDKQEIKDYYRVYGDYIRAKITYKGEEYFNGMKLDDYENMVKQAIAEVDAEKSDTVYI